MTKRQDKWYWREWSKVVRYCRANNLTAPDRHELHAKALGQDKSHVDFDDDDTDDVLAVFMAISEPSNLIAQTRLTNMRKTRRIHKIKRLAPESYWRAEANRKFGTDDLESLSLSDLTIFRNHCAKRAPEIRWPAAQVPQPF